MSVYARVCLSECVCACVRVCGTDHMFLSEDAAVLCVIPVVFGSFVRGGRVCLRESETLHARCVCVSLCSGFSSLVPSSFLSLLLQVICPHLTSPFFLYPLLLSAADDAGHPLSVCSNSAPLSPLLLATALNQF